MSSRTPHIILAILLLFVSVAGFAQNAVSVRASINRDKIMIGEPIELQLEVSMPADVQATWFPLDTLSHFEFIQKGKIDSSGTGDSRTYRQQLTITSFDSGRWALPALPLAIGNREYLTDSLPVSVAYSNFDPNQDYHDIKDIIEVENKATRYIPWVILALAIVSLALVIYLLRRRTMAAEVPVIKKPLSKLSPLEEALQQLASLQQEGYTAPGALKSYHTGLNDVLRGYMYRKTSVATMEKTSGELMMQLQAYQLPAPAFTKLAQVLRMNDAVKFARYHPPAEENETALQTIKTTLQEIDALISKTTT
ncbi:MAG TPA: hypothetical protein VL307_12690 [Chitinophagaceae bacterium]|nr:hypothetical protein [Chitinophagaceae bacterium]